LISLPKSHFSIRRVHGCPLHVSSKKVRKEDSDVKEGMKEERKAG
jgi:hypothetical protein